MLARQIVFFSNVVMKIIEFDNSRPVAGEIPLYRPAI